MLKQYKKETMGVAAFWNDRMPMMAMEEAGELIQAISKYVREMDDLDETESYQNLVDEIGDMYISLMALQTYCAIPDDEITARIEKKLNKKY